MKHLVFTLHFWLKRSPGKINGKNVNKYNKVNTRQKGKCDTRSTKISK